MTRKILGVAAAMLVLGGLTGCGGDTSEAAPESFSATASAGVTGEQEAVLAQEA